MSGIALALVLIGGYVVVGMAVIYWRQLRRERRWGR